MIKMQRQYNRICVILLSLMMAGLMGCAARSSDIQHTKPNMTELTPAEKRFNRKVTDRAAFFTKRSQSIYNGKQETSPWWRKLWPWGQKTKQSKSTVNMKEWHFSAKYQNTNNKKKL